MTRLLLPDLVAATLISSSAAEERPAAANAVEVMPLKAGDGFVQRQQHCLVSGRPETDDAGWSRHHAGSPPGSKVEPAFARVPGREVATWKLKEPHTCRGLNTCKGKDATKKYSCADMGNCATAKAHECKGMNECKGQGGCGAKRGENACKEISEYAVPLSEKSWKSARKNFETAMMKAGKKFGDAPKPKKS